MRTYLILAHSEVTANALNSWLKIMGAAVLPAGDKRRIVWDDNALGADAAITAYELLVSRIEQAIKAEDGTVPMNEVVVLVDSVRPDKLSAIYEECSWEHLLALLILSFPEIHWAFGVVEDDGSFPVGHTLETLWAKCHRNPLMDPTGLRTWVRSQTNRELRKTGDDLKLPERKALAAAIDEEGHYAYLNAYTAYRFGCRADIVTTWALMKELFGSDDRTSHGYWLLLEDMSLNFADKPDKTHLLRLERYIDEDKNEQGRAFWCPKLNSGDVMEDSEHRVLVTTGQSRDDSTLEDNQNYLRAKKKGKGKWVFKPARGIFGLWRDAELLTKQSFFKSARNVVLDFEWPPELPSKYTSWRKVIVWRSSRRGHKGHGSPGKLMLVTGTLIRRSRALLMKTGSIEDAIQGAVLAVDALELTGGRTPTSAVDALTLKHHFEVLAECQFSGVAHQIDTKWRLKEIDSETESISGWYQQKEIEKAKLNALMHVLNRLVQVFREHNNFDEEQQCMIRARNIHNSLWLKKYPWRYPFKPLLRYFELLMKSISWFVVCLALWVLAFGWLFKWAASYPTYWHGLFDAMTSIFAISGPFSHQLSHVGFQVPSFYAAVVCCAIIVGIAHLGVFVSHLYTIVSRK